MTHWLIFKPLSSFLRHNGRLIHMKGIESTQVLVRFENKSAVYNAVDVLRDRLNQGDADLGSGGLFAGRPLEVQQCRNGTHGNAKHRTYKLCSVISRCSKIG